MNEKITIWHVGNTGLRNPNRIQEGFSVFADSPFVGNLREENEVAFMKYLNEKGIIHNKEGNDISGSHARKWRLMFARNGFIYPQVKKKDGRQEELGALDDITPFGKAFLKGCDRGCGASETDIPGASVQGRRGEDLHHG